VLEIVSQIYYSSSPKPALVCRCVEGEVLLLQIFKLGFWSGFCACDIQDQLIFFVCKSCSKLAEGHVILEWLEWAPNDSRGSSSFAILQAPLLSCVQ
jgi:hypothetical protein